MGRVIITAVLLCTATSGVAAPASVPVDGDYFMVGSKLHYHTLGAPTHDETGLITNAVLLLGGAGESVENFLSEPIQGALFGPGQPLDASQYFLILPEAAGTSAEIVLMQYRLVLEHLGVNHLRMIMGNATGGGQAWLWASTHPYFVDALVVIDCLATQPPILADGQLAAVRTKAVAIVDDEALTPDRLAILEDEIARVKHGRYVIVRKDYAGASAGAISMVKQWKAILPELLEVPENQ